MRTNQEPSATYTTASSERSHERGVPDGRGGEIDRRTLHLAFTDALADILRWEASRTRASRH